jgi:hypothetical protein
LKNGFQLLGTFKAYDSRDTTLLWYSPHKYIICHTQHIVI